MQNNTRSPLRRLTLGAATLALAGGLHIQAKAQGPAPDPPGRGAICAAAIFTATAEFGARCRTGQDPEFQAELGRSVSRVDAYIQQNGKITDAQMTEFKREQGGVGLPVDALCNSSASRIYDSLKGQGAAKLRSDVDKLVARPGEPTWGTCL